MAVSHSVKINIQPLLQPFEGQNIRALNAAAREIAQQIQQPLQQIGITLNPNSIKGVKTLQTFLESINASIQQTNSGLRITTQNAEGLQQALSLSKSGRSWATTDVSRSANRVSSVKELQLAYQNLFNAMKQVNTLEEQGDAYTPAWETATATLQHYDAALEGVINNLIRRHGLSVEMNEDLGKELISGNGQIAQTQEALEHKRLQIELNHELIMSNQERQAQEQQQIAQQRQEAAQAKQNEQNVRLYITALKDQLVQEEKLQKLRQTKAPANVISAQQQVVRQAENIANGYRKAVIGTKEYANAQPQLQLELAKSKQRIAEVSTVTKKSNNIFGNMAATFKNVIQSGASWQVFSLMYQTINKTIDTVVELDQSVVDLQIVMGTSREEAEAYIKTYNQMAQTLGATTNEVADASVEWQRQGYSVQDTNTLIRNSMILSKVGMIESSEATEYLTSAMKGYKVSVEDSLGVIDKLTSIDMKAAVSAGGLAEAMSRTAASAKLAGVDMNQLLGYLATVGEVTQKSMSQVGESFKTIFARFGQVKAGKFVDDETGDNLNDIAKVLSKFNIELYDAQGNMRNVGTILDELAAGWANYTDVERNALSTAIAGTRQRENFIVLMDNYTKAMEYAGVAVDSAGTAEEKFAAYTEGIEGKINTLKSAAQGLAETILDSGLVAGIVDLGTGFVNLVNNGFTQFIVKAFLVATAGKLIFKVLDGIPSLLIKMNTNGTILTKGMKYLSKAFSYFGLRAKASATGAAKGMITLAQAEELAAAKAALVNVAVGAIALAVTAGIVLYQKYHKSLEDINQEYETSVSNLESTKSEIESNEQRIRELQALGTLTFVEQEELDKLRESNQLLKENQILEEQKVEADRRKNIKAQYKAYKNYGFGEGDSSDLQSYINYQEQVLDYEQQILQLRAQGQQASVGQIDILSYDMEQASSAAGALKAEFNDLQNYQASLWEAEQARLKGNEEEYRRLTSSANNYKKNLVSQAQATKNLIDLINASSDEELYLQFGENWKNITEQIKQTYQQIMLVIAPGEYKQIKWDEVLNSDEFSGVAAKFKAEMQDLVDKQTDEKEIADVLKAKYGNLVEALGTYGITIEDIINQFSTGTQATSEYENAVSSLSDDIKSLQSAYETLSDAIDEYNSNGAISAETWDKLLSLDAEYLSVLFDENGAIVNNTKALENNLQTKLQQKAIQAGINYLQSLASLSSEQLTTTLNGQTEAEYNLTSALLEQARAQLALIQNDELRRKAAERFINIVKSVNNVTLQSVSTTKSSTSAKSAATQQESKYKSVINYAKNVLQEQIDALEEQKDAIEENNKALQNEIDLYDKALSYINKVIDGRISALEKEKDALKEKNDEQERANELEELQMNLRKAQQRTMRVYYEDKGWVWEQDPSAIKEAQDALNDFNQETQESEIDKQIQAWEDYKSLWEEIPSAYEAMADELAFKQSQSFVTEQDILNQRTNGLEDFKNAYIEKQKQVTNGTTDSINSQIEKLKEIQSQWTSIPDEYQKSSDALIGQQELGKNAREQILNADASLIENFANRYKAAMDEAAKATETASGQINSSLEKIKSPEINLDELMSAGSYKYESAWGKKYATVVTGASGEEFIYNPMLKQYFRKSQVQEKDGKYIIPGGTPYYSAAYASGTRSAKAGLANVDENGNEIIVPNQGRYRMMEYGDSVIPHNLSQRIFDIATNPVQFIAKAFTAVKSPILTQGTSNSNTTNINIENITMPNSVNNADSFVKQLQLISINR